MEPGEAYKIVAAVLRRSRVNIDTLDEARTRVKKQQSLADLLFQEEILDLCPDIFPPAFVGAYIDEDKNYGYKIGDAPEDFFRRKFSNRRVDTLTQLYRQILSAAKADATRRTTTVHPIIFNGTQQGYQGARERYFVFYEALALHSLAFCDPLLAEDAPELHEVERAIAGYQTATGKDVMDQFFATIRQFKNLGIGQQRDVKRKYPFHGVMYGDALHLPQAMKEKMQAAGNHIFGKFREQLRKPQDALFFSLDFFIVDDTLYVGADVHEHPIGMGIQEHLGVQGTDEFYSMLATILAQRAQQGIVGINYDPSLCLQNRLYTMEIEAMRKRLRQEGYVVVENADAPFVLRMYGGNKGIPEPEITAVTENRIQILRLLHEERKALEEKGVLVPKTYPCKAQELIESPALRDEVMDVLGTEQVFIHPTREHIFKPFEVNLEYTGTSHVLEMTLQKAGCLEATVLTMERLRNGIGFGSKRYPHEIRAYYLLAHP